MADLTITPADVLAAAGATIARNSLSGEALEIGDVVYQDAQDGNKLKKAQAVDGKREVYGICLNSTDATDQPVAVITNGNLSLGSILTVGTVYGLSATAGKIAPIADLVSSDFVTVLGPADTTSILKVNTGPGLRADNPIA